MLIRFISRFTIYLFNFFLNRLHLVLHEYVHTFDVMFFVVKTWDLNTPCTFLQSDMTLMQKKKMGTYPGLLGKVLYRHLCGHAVQILCLDIHQLWASTYIPTIKFSFEPNKLYPWYWAQDLDIFMIIRHYYLISMHAPIIK